MNPDALVHMLLAAAEEYRQAVSPHYDETLKAVSGRIAAAKSADKADIGALLFWKRLRADTPWTSALQSRPDEEIRERTGTAFALVNDLGLSLREAARLGREALQPLPGFGSGPAMPSALLLACAPERMAVYDRRADAGLRRLGLDSQGRYSVYMGVIEDLVDVLAGAGHDWIPRDVDVALFQLGR